MPEIAKAPIADQGQRRASFQQARPHQTKRSLVQAAMALWCTNGYAGTTVADICRAAGVSKASFYFYFPRKEDVLFVVGVVSRTSVIFAEVFQRAKQHGKLPAHFDVEPVANVAQSLVSEGARHWASGAYGDRSFAEVVGRDIAALVAGYSVS